METLFLLSAQGLLGGLVVLCLPASLYLALLTLAALRSPPSPPPSPRWPGRIALLVPAHDEAAGIAATVAALLPLVRADGGCALIVIADNCTDQTAALAAAAGARVLRRDDPARRGKGAALAWAFAELQAEGWAAYLVVDADSRADPDLLPVLRQHFAAGAAAVQCRYLPLPLADEGAAACLTRLALTAFNELRPQARAVLGASAGILGNGFALHAATLQQVPYTANSLVEDLEYHHLLLAAGFRVAYAANVSVYGEMPGSGAGQRTQRSRWEGGRLRVCRQALPGLLAGALKGRWRLLEAALELWLPPLAWHLLSLLALAALGAGLAQPWALAGASAGLLVLLAHGLLAAFRAGIVPARWPSLLWAICRYLLWKLRLLPQIFAAASTAARWQRTERNPSP